MQPKYKMVRATRTGSWDGHRHRAGAVFPVRADVKDECWFVTVGPAPDDVELPPQLTGPQAPPQKTFTQIMHELGPGEPRIEGVGAAPKTLAEAGNASPQADTADLL